MTKEYNSSTLKCHYTQDFHLDLPADGSQESGTARRFNPQQSLAVVFNGEKSHECFPSERFLHVLRGKWSLRGRGEGRGMQCLPTLLCSTSSTCRHKKAHLAAKLCGTLQCLGCRFRYCTRSLVKIGIVCKDSHQDGPVALHSNTRWKLRQN